MFRADNSVCLNHITDRPSDTVYFILKAVDARGGFLADMHNCGFFRTSHVESSYNRSDIGTKVPSGIPCQEWFRTLVGLQPCATAPWDTRVRKFRDVHGPAPPELKAIPIEVLQEIRGYFARLCCSVHGRDGFFGRAFLAKAPGR